MFFNVIDVALVNNHFVYMKLGNDILLLNFKTVVAEALIDRCNNRKRSFPTRRPNKRKPHKPSCPEKSQSTCPNFRRSEGDIIIARMKAQITKHLCLARHVDCIYAWIKRETVIWSIICSFLSRLHCLLYTFSKINYCCVDCLISFYHKYHIASFDSEDQSVIQKVCS